MLRRFFYLIITLAAFGWIVYNALELVTDKDKSNPYHLFGALDGRILVLNRADEVSISDILFSIKPENREIIQKIISQWKRGDKLFISEKEDHFVWQRSDYWTKETAQLALLSLGGEFSKIGMRSFHWENHSVRYAKNILDFHHPNTPKLQHTSDWTTYDKKSSFSIISFKNFEVAYSDYYKKDGEIYEYNRVKSKYITGNPIVDEKLFSKYLPANIQSYHFLERDYLSQKEIQFATSPLRQWVQTGLVQFEFKNSKIIVFDLTPGSDMANLMQSTIAKKDYNEIEQHFSSVAFLSQFSNRSNSKYYYKSIDDFVYISTNQQVLNEVDASIKMEKTLSSSSDLAKSIFANGPKSVVERFWDKTNHFAHTLYHEFLISAKTSSSNTKTVALEKSQEITSTTLAGLGRIESFIVHPTKTIVLLINDNNELLVYKNGQKVNSIKLTSKPIGLIQYLSKGSLAGNFLISTQSNIHLVDENGNALQGFPIQSEDYLIQQTEYLSLNGLELIIAPLQNGKYARYSINGSKKSVTSVSQGEFSHAPISWISQRNSFIGLYDGNKFSMIDAKKDRVFRSFTLPEPYIPIVLVNEVLFYTLKQGKLTQYDQKGQSKSINNTTYKKIWQKPGSNEFWVFTDQQAILFDCFGNEQLSLADISTSNIEYIDHIIHQNKNYTVLLDGLNNQLLCYENKQRIQEKSSLKGEKGLNLHVEPNNVISVYTVLDQYISSYKLK